jgi:hypothetical protein
MKKTDLVSTIAFIIGRFLLLGRNCLGHLGIDGRIILKYIRKETGLGLVFEN